MRSVKILLIAATTSFACGAMSSALAMMSATEGWYLEANVGSTKLSNQGYPALASSSSSGIGGNLNLGYKFMPYAAAELGYTQYANTTIKDQFGNKAAKDRHYSYDIAVKGILPIADSGFEPFAKLGVARLNSKITISNETAANNINLQSSNRNTNNLYMAVGAQYYFMPEMAMNVQWARARGNRTTGTLDLISAGVSFIFD